MMPKTSRTKHLVKHNCFTKSISVFPITMRRVKRKFLIVAGLFISGLNPLWATSSQKITPNIHRESSKKTIQKQVDLIYELNSLIIFVILSFLFLSITSPFQRTLSININPFLEINLKARS